MGSDLYSKTDESSSSDSIPKQFHNSLLGEDVPSFEHVPNESSDDTGSSYKSTSPPMRWFPHNEEGPPLSYTVDVNILWWVLLALAFITRFWKIDFPNFVM